MLLYSIVYTQYINISTISTSDWRAQRFEHEVPELFCSISVQQLQNFNSW
jgi:hypothetical protein